MSALHQLLDYGQSCWLDNLTREILVGGELRRRISEEALRGVTSNPAIFHKAIASGKAYDDDIDTLVRHGRSISEIYDSLVVSDIQQACDLLRPVYDESAGRDGYVSLEVSPYVAYDATGSLEEARRLNLLVARPNVFIKIPGTQAAFSAIEDALFEGININITLLFSIANYEAVAEAYLAALERRVEAGQRVDNVASVASFFLSRIDVLVDELLSHRIESARDRRGPDAPNSPGTIDPEPLLGKIAIANARLAYQSLLRMLATDRWKAMEAQGARVQRLLWASTATKDPLYDELRYVEPLVGRHTINTMTPDTIRIFAERGVVASTVERDLDEARETMALLAKTGIDFDNVTWQLEHDAIQKFREPFDALMATLAERRQSVLEGEVASQTIQAGPLQEPVDAALKALDLRQFGRRLFAKDASLWTKDHLAQESIHDRLGWLDGIEGMRARITDVTALADRVRSEGFTHVVLLGMGGSSLSADVSRHTFGRAEGWPELVVLDSTHPEAIRDVERRIELARTLFVVASKSGTTIETMGLYQYFWEAAGRAIGASPGYHFVAITDAGTPLAFDARAQGFRRSFDSPQDVGGRYAALFDFGIVPMALLGLDVAGLLNRAVSMQRACGPFVPAKSNPALHLGLTLGLAARRGRDKVTFVPSGPLGAFGIWAEQLLAESTGKQGHGLVPIVGEPLGGANTYGSDRVFVDVGLSHDRDKETDAFLRARAKEGHPIVRIEVTEPLDIGAECLRWEIATSVAGAILGVNPFDQPNVAESKYRTEELLEQRTSAPSLDHQKPLVVEDWGTIHGGAPPLAGMSGTGRHRPEEVLEHFFADVRPPSYVALLAYMHQTEATDRSLTPLRTWIRDHLKVATTVGYGPRYLHSTGQLHKGGPPTGLFLLLTTDLSEELPIPGQPYAFGALLRAQALGDYQSLVEHGRRVLHVHLRNPVDAALSHLDTAIQSAVAGQPARVLVRKSARDAR